MDEKELRAAAGRLTEGVRRPVYAWPLAAQVAIADGIVLAEAYLKEHLADDPAPVTEDWLRAVGCETRGGRLCLGEQLQFTHFVTWNAWWAVRGAPHISSRLVDGLATRGQVRALCAALGIPLKEGAG